MNTHAPASPPERVEVVEVGPRDGLQIEKDFVPTARKIEIVNAMVASGIRQIEVSSFVSPRAVPQLADAEQVIEGVRRGPHTSLMALTPNLRAAERAARTSLDAGVILCSATQTHNRKNLNRSIEESMASFGPIADRLRSADISVHGGIATAFGCPFEGEVDVRDVLRICQAFADLDVDHVTLGDTTGMATPPTIRRLVRALAERYPRITFSLHLHNTRGIGLANAMVGLQEGIRRFDASVGGLGGCPFAAGATGNVCTEDLVFLLQESGYETGIDLGDAIATAHMMEQTLGRTLSGQVMRAGPRLALHDAAGVRTAAG